MKKKLLVAVFITTILGNSMIVSAGFTPMYKPVSVKIILMSHLLQLHP